MCPHSTASHPRSRRHDHAVTDPKARPPWARHFEIGSNRPVFAGRDGIKKYALAEIERERRTGTACYGSWPLRLVETECPQGCRQVAGRTGDIAIVDNC
ncbi:pectate lyase [Singulisphaera sp. Ch08]|uniref:pectate lyase n=1 Tax=Singulisphaera sp. Ch08 TaxID=3120278 RepID=UPI003872D7FC